MGFFGITWVYMGVNGREWALAVKKALSAGPFTLPVQGFANIAHVIVR
jgi:hypothetical protein